MPAPRPITAASTLGLCLVLTAPAALAQQSGKAPPAPSPVAAPDPIPVPPEMVARRNAALVYYRAWEGMNADDWNLVSHGFETRPDVRLSEAQLKVLMENQPFVQALLRAASTADCDWGVQYDEGFRALLPHLGKLRASCRFLAADARRCTQDGDPTGAAKRIAAIVRMSDQLRSDGVLISALVGAAVNQVAVITTEQMLKGNELTPESARLILNAFKSMHTDDLFGSRTSIRLEGWMATQWPRQHFTGPTAGADFYKEMSGMGANAEAPPEPLAALDGEGLAAELDKLTAYYDEVQRAWDSPKAQVELLAIQAKVADGAYGEAAKVLAAAFSKAHSSVEKSLAAIQKSITLLETYLREGNAPPANP